MRIDLMTTVAIASLALAACSQQTKDSADSAGENAGAAVQGAIDDTAANASEAAKKASDVRFVFTFPAIWDLAVWVIPNAAGAFADKNPDVKPVKPKASM